MIDNFFDAFNITSVPREKNIEADPLATTDRTFKPPLILKIKHEVGMRYIASILENIKHWQLFEDDKQIRRFLKMVEEISATDIDQEGVSGTETSEQEKVTPSEEEDITHASLVNQIAGHKILHLKSNFIPKGLVPLEKIFDGNDIPVKPTI